MCKCALRLLRARRWLAVTAWTPPRPASRLPTQGCARRPLHWNPRRCLQRFTQRSPSQLPTQESSHSLCGPGVRAQRGRVLCGAVGSAEAPRGTHSQAQSPAGCRCRLPQFSPRGSPNEAAPASRGGRGQPGGAALPYRGHTARAAQHRRLFCRLEAGGRSARGPAEGSQEAVRTWGRRDGGPPSARRPFPHLPGLRHPALRHPALRCPTPRCPAHPTVPAPGAPPALTLLAWDSRHDAHWASGRLGALSAPLLKPRVPL